MKENKKFNISRKLLYIGIVVLIPIVCLLIWMVSGFVGNNLDSSLKDELSITELNYKKQSDINDFVFNFQLTEQTKATDSSSGSLKFRAVFTKNTNTTPSNVTFKVVAADYWTHYVSSAYTLSSGFAPTTSGTTKTGTISSIAYSNKNGWGLTKKVTDKPEIYVYLSYKFENESGKISNESYIVKYSFDDVFKGSINA